MANINIQITDELHKKLKVNSVMSSKTLKDYIIDQLAKEAQREAKNLGV